MAQRDETSRSAEQWGARLDPSLSEQLHDVREQRDWSKSETLRQLVRDGLDEPSRNELWARDIRQMADHLVALGVVATVAAVAWPTGGLIPAAILGMTFWTVSATNYLIANWMRDQDA